MCIRDRFTTHESSIMDQAIFRRDEILFVERDAENASSIYSLEDLEHRVSEHSAACLLYTSREISWLKATKSNNYHLCSSRVNVADIWRERACTLSVEVSQRFHLPSNNEL